MFIRLKLIMSLFSSSAGNTIMNFLVDFRNFSYTIEITKGLNIHMEEKKTSVFIPRNRFDQIMKVLNNSTDQLVLFLIFQK